MNSGFAHYKKTQNLLKRIELGHTTITESLTGWPEAPLLMYKLKSQGLIINCYD